MTLSLEMGELNDQAGRKVFSTPDAICTKSLTEALERSDTHDYRIPGPTLEDVFLRTAIVITTNVSICNSTIRSHRGASKRWQDT